MLIWKWFLLSFGPPFRERLLFLNEGWVGSLHSNGKHISPQMGKTSFSCFDQQACCYIHVKSALRPFNILGFDHENRGIHRYSIVSIDGIFREMGHELRSKWVHGQLLFCVVIRSILLFWFHFQNKQAKSKQTSGRIHQGVIDPKVTFDVTLRKAFIVTFTIVEQFFVFMKDLGTKLKYWQRA